MGYLLGSLMHAKALGYVEQGTGKKNPPNCKMRKDGGSHSSHVLWVDFDFESLIAPHLKESLSDYA